jgi:hypothetical protein
MRSIHRCYPVFHGLNVNSLTSLFYLDCTAVSAEVMAEPHASTCNGVKTAGKAF